MINDILIIFATLICIALLIYYFFTREVEEERAEEKFSYMSLKKDVEDMINDYIGASVVGLGLTDKESQNQEAKRSAFATSVREYSGGNAGARDSVQEFIRTHLLRDRGLNKKNILHAIPFDRPHDMSARHLMSLMLLHFDGGENRGFRVLLDTYNIAAPKMDETGNTYREITDYDVRSTYELIKMKPTFDEQVAVLVQSLCADTHGLGPIEELNAQKDSVEEIQIGLTGVQQKAYNYKHNLVGMEKKLDVVASKDAVHILLRGETVRLSYLTFGTEDEKQRVIRNLIRSNGDAGELTIKNPKVGVDAPDGRRITAGRPPFTDAWVSLVRKFDSVDIRSLDEMYTDLNGGDIAVGVLKQLVRAGFPIAYTGEMAAGKTSLFRAALKEARPDLNIRTIEAGAFELDVRQYLMGRNVLPMRLTDWMTEEEVLAFARKTTGNCFCVGEVNSLRMAVLTMAVSKISLQTMFSAHYVTTTEMIADFTNANLCRGGYTSEKLAEMDAVRALGFDVHIKKRDGRRYISSIVEIIPEFNMERGFSTENITKDNARVKAVEVLREVRRQLGRINTYSLRKILEYDEDLGSYVCYNAPSEARRIRAKEYMSTKQYKEYEEFFDLYFDDTSKNASAVETKRDDGLLSAGIVTEEEFPTMEGYTEETVAQAIEELQVQEMTEKEFASLFENSELGQASMTGMEAMFERMEEE